MGVVMEDKIEVKKEDKEVKVDEVSISDNLTSDKKEIKVEEKEETKEPSETEKLSAQLNELNDKYLRLAAELDNTRRRAALDAESRARNRAMSVAQKFLPVMDAVEAALKHSPDDEGIKSMKLAMENAFAQIGITKIESVGQILNPQYHNAIQVVDLSTDDKSDKKSNTIIEEMQPGYMFGDTVLRTAMVVVSK